MFFYEPVYIKNDEAFWEGYRAYTNDQARYSNPYSLNEEDKYYSWKEGWFAAGEDD